MQSNHSGANQDDLFAEPSGAHEQEAPAGPGKTLVLIDGANFMYRSYHAMKSMGRSFSAPDGTPTAALMNFATMVSKAKVTAGGDALAILFESTKGTFRDGLFPEYKAHRPATPSEVKIQMNLARDIFPLMGVPVLWVDGFEADDVMCAYGKNAPPGWRVVMASSDKDIGQAIGPKTVQLIPDGWKILDEQGLLIKFGVEASMMAQFLALQGDSVDNIPGVDKCGFKTASKLLNLHGSIEGIYKNLDTLTPAIKKGFEDARDRIPQLMKLTTADTSCGMPMTPDEIHLYNHSPDWEGALEKLRPLAMGRMIEKAEKSLAAQLAKAERLSIPSSLSCRP